MSDRLPLWALFIQALGTPFAAVVFGGVTSWIALRQWKTSRDKLRFDLFERRFAVYEATRKLISKVGLGGTLEKGDLWTFEDATRGAEFLFQGPAREFLKKIGGMAEAVIISGMVQGETREEERLRLLKERQNELLEFIAFQNSQIAHFDSMFRTHLDLSKV
jgi:hypothetical protein